MDLCMDVQLARKLSKIVHDECKDVPHDIGITPERCITEHLRRAFRDVDEFCED